MERGSSAAFVIFRAKDPDWRFPRKQQLDARASIQLSWPRPLFSGRRSRSHYILVRAFRKPQILRPVRLRIRMAFHGTFAGAQNQLLGRQPGRIGSTGSPELSC